MNNQRKNVVNSKVKQCPQQKAERPGERSLNKLSESIRLQGFVFEIVDDDRKRKIF